METGLIAIATAIAIALSTLGPGIGQGIALGLCKAGAAILALARRYSPDEPAEKVDAEIARYWDALCMLELTPDHITGKECIELVGR